MECIPLENMTAETVVRTIYNEWIPRYGCPQTIVTDQGRQFESEIFKIFASSFGIHLNRTTAYHPQCNGLVERLHRTLKTALMCHDADSWTLPMVLLGLRTQFKEVLQAFAAEVLYGEPLRIPGLNQRLNQLNKTSQPLRGPKSPKNPFLLTKNNHGWSIAISRGQRKMYLRSNPDFQS
ncbi:Hypothetical predicted protein [Cloeon dipterum]|uniref:Integrase catalytic domain-containing protein n=1 Tax=Cloeon dipterum TaxID=197152 RepID=A0A8S1D7M7_9INSE|nr:Hypothetical predicted protein [Cloeon dipterum]